VQRNQKLVSDGTAIQTERRFLGHAEVFVRPWSYPLLVRSPAGFESLLWRQFLWMVWMRVMVLKNWAAKDLMLW